MQSYFRFYSGMMIVARVEVSPYGQEKVELRNEDDAIFTITSAEFVTPGREPLPIFANFPFTIHGRETLTLNFDDARASTILRH